MRKITGSVLDEKVPALLPSETRDLLVMPPLALRRSSDKSSLPPSRQVLARRLEEAIRARRGTNVRVALMPDRDD